MKLFDKTFRRDKDFISQKYAEHFKPRYCKQCGRKLVYTGKETYYNQDAGKPHYKYVFACPRFFWGLTFTRHDAIRFSFGENCASLSG